MPADAARQVARPIFFATLIIITAYLPAVRVPAHRGEAVLSDGLCGRLCAVRRAVACAHAGAGACLPRVSQAAARVPQSRARLARSRVSAIARTASLRRPGIVYLVSRGRRRRRGRARPDGLARIPARARRRLDLASCARCPAEFRFAKAMEMDAELRKAVLEFPEVVDHRHPLGRNDDGTDPWTPSHVEARHRPAALRHLAGGGDQAGPDPPHAGAARASCRATKSPSANRSSTASTTRSSSRTASSRSKYSATISMNCAASRKDVAEVLKTVPGTADVLVDDRPPLAQIAIKPDREAAARYGINVADITDLIQTGIGGGGGEPGLHRRAPLRCHCPLSTSQARNSPEAIGNLVLTSSSGALVPLSQVARIQVAAGRKHHQPRHESPLSHGEVQFRRPQPAGAVWRTPSAPSPRRSSSIRDATASNGVGHFEGEQRAEARFGLILGLILGLMIVSALRRVRRCCARWR